jgi:DNA-binding response OmpR family regulator
LIAEGYRIPVIFVTAACAESERSRMLNAGALGILPKPFDTRPLIECLNQALWHIGFESRSELKAGTFCSDLYLGINDKYHELV